MSNGTLLIAFGSGTAVVGTIIFGVLKVWLYKYGKRVKEELDHRYE